MWQSTVKLSKRMQQQRPKLFYLKGKLYFLESRPFWKKVRKNLISGKFNVDWCMYVQVKPILVHIQTIGCRHNINCFLINRYRNLMQPNVWLRTYNYLYANSKTNVLFATNRLVAHLKWHICIDKNIFFSVTNLNLFVG